MKCTNMSSFHFHILSSKFFKCLSYARFEFSLFSGFSSITLCLVALKGREGKEKEKKTLLHMFLDVKGKRNERKKKKILAVHALCTQRAFLIILSHYPLKKKKMNEKIIIKNYFPLLTL
jgi:hypothetical protein